MVFALAGDSTMTSALSFPRLGVAIFLAVAGPTAAGAALTAALFLAAGALPPAFAFAGAGSGDLALAAVLGALFAAPSLALLPATTRFVVGLASGAGCADCAAVWSWATTALVAFLLTAMGHLVSTAGQASHPAGELGFGQHAQRGWQRNAEPLRNASRVVRAISQQREQR